MMRQEELLARHAEEWLAPLRAIFPKHLEREVAFARGWISELFALRVTLEQGVQMAALPDLRLLRKLHVGETERPDTDQGPPPPGRCLSNVRVFQVGHDPKFGGAGAEGRGPVVPFLAQGMPRLRELLLFAREPDANALFELTNLTHLRLLRYEGGIRYPLQLLGENPSLRRLRSLLCLPSPMASIDEARIDRDDLAAIVHSPHLTRLTHLRLRMASFGDEGCEEIVESGVLERLKWLDLSHGTITDEGAILLAECPDTNNLEALDLSANALTADGVAVLKENLPGVRLRIGGQHRRGAEQDLLEEEWE
jgi:hypothetical protein